VIDIIFYGDCYIFVRFDGFSSPFPATDAVGIGFGSSEGEQAIGVVEK
jgi:hypothetical protein